MEIHPQSLEQEDNSSFKQNRSQVGITPTSLSSPSSSSSSSSTTTTTKHRYKPIQETDLDDNIIETIPNQISSPIIDQTSDQAPMITPDTMESPKISSPARDGLAIVNRRYYDRLYYFSQILGLFIFILVLIWLIEHLNGISFETPAQIFNFHPMFMVLGFIIIYSNAILIYRSFRVELKHKLKLFHTIMNISVMLISLFGSLAAIYFHHKANISHFYSLHSWLGISTWLLFVTQFCSGFITYLYPGASFSFRKLIMPFHRYFGIAIFTLALATCLTGLNEKAIFAFKNPAYSSLAWNGILTNIIGLLLSAYGIIIVYLVTKPEYQRRPLPEEISGPNRRSSISYYSSSHSS